MSGHMKEDKILEKVSGESGSVKETGFGCSQKDRRNEVKEAMGGSNSGRPRGD